MSLIQASAGPFSFQGNVMKYPDVSTKCLNGVTVVELGQVLAAPFGGMIFADLGADVIKVERPDGGDDGRRMGPPYGASDSLIFQDLNRGKKSVAIDLKSPEGRAALFRLIAKADVVINNLRPGVAEAGAFDGKSLIKQFPRLIFCNLSAFGSEGPMKDQPGYEPLVQAFSGLASTNGFQGNEPVRTGPSVVDLGSGMWLVLSALAALRRRDETGSGALIDLSLLETALTWIGPDTSSYLNEGKLAGRRGNAHPLLVPYEAFVASDGAVMIAAGNDRQFQKLAAALDRPEWAVHESYRTNAARLKHRSELVTAIGAIICTQCRAHWLDLFTAHGIPAAVFNNIAEAMESEQVRSLNVARLSPETGRLMMGLPFRIDGERPGGLGPAPQVGQHNDVLRGAQFDDRDVSPLLI